MIIVLLLFVFILKNRLEDYLFIFLRSAVICGGHLFAHVSFAFCYFCVPFVRNLPVPKTPKYFKLITRERKIVNGKREVKEALASGDDRRLGRALFNLGKIHVEGGNHRRGLNALKSADPFILRCLPEEYYKLEKWLGFTHTRLIEDFRFSAGWNFPKAERHLVSALKGVKNEAEEREVLNHLRDLYILCNMPELEKIIAKKLIEPSR